jgi:hypothetical protein
MAGTTGLEPATSDVTGRRSDQLNYVPENPWQYRDFKRLHNNYSMGRPVSPGACRASHNLLMAARESRH